MVVLDDNSEIHQSYYTLSWGMYKLKEIHSIFVKTSHLNPPKKTKK